jgi:hypothetical protein
VIELPGADERVDLAVVGCGVLQDGGDHPGLVVSGDGGVASVAEGQPQHALAVVALPLPFQPLGEEGRTQVGGAERVAVQHPLGDPILLTPETDAPKKRSADIQIRGLGAARRR